MHPQLFLGTCAWSFEAWSGVFYPPQLAASDRLEWYARHLGAVEVDATFYRVPECKTVAHWRDVTPNHFRFACKVPREITHAMRLRDSGPEMSAFLKAIEPFGEKLGAVLAQLPPTFSPEQDGLAFSKWCHALPEGFPFAVEFRHSGWHTAHWVHALEKKGVAWVWTDTSPLEEMERGPFGFLPETAPFLYVRLLGDLDTKYGADGKTVYRYTRRLWSRAASLDLWARRIGDHLRGAKTAYVFVNNHFEGFSPGTCRDLAERLGIQVALPDAETWRERERQMQLF